MMSICIRIVVLFALLMLYSCSKQKAMSQTTVTVNGHQLSVEVATTDSEKENGLKNRSCLADGQGMLFVFKRPSDVYVWMKDTQIPLSAAFLDEHGSIINITEMDPMSEIEHCSTRPASYVLEVRRGWFVAHNIKPGMLVSLK